MLFVLSFVRSFVSWQCWPRSGQNGTTTHDHARPTAHDHARPTAHDRARPRTTTNDHEWPTTHARPRTTAHDRPRTTTHDHARPRTTTHDHAWPRTTTHDHARPRTTTHDRPRTTTHGHARPRTTTHDRARPRTTAHDRARPRTTTHDRPRTHDRARPTTHDRARPTTHDRARPTTAAIFVWGSGTHPTPGGFRELNCLARLALARERTPSILKMAKKLFWKVVNNLYFNRPKLYHAFSCILIYFSQCIYSDSIKIIMWLFHFRMWRGRQCILSWKPSEKVKSLPLLLLGEPSTRERT